jgi:hypothetical protein
VTARRCPSCGGLVGADLEWCGQCLTRLDRQEPEPSTASEPEPGHELEPSPGPGVEPLSADPASPNGHGATGAVPEPRTGGPAGPARHAGLAASDVRVEAGQVLWSCPLCAAENPIAVRNCGRCGTPFGRLFEEPEPPARVSPERAAGLSLVFPGAGHVAARKVADGLARAVVFAFTLTMVLAILFAGGGIGGPLTPLLVLFGGASAIVYGATAVDAARAVRKDPPILTTRMLLIGATVLLGLAVVVLVLGGSRLSSR